MTMLISQKKLNNQVIKLKPKLEKILNIQKKSPEKYKKNAQHLSHHRTLFPYIYYTAIVEEYIKNKNSYLLDWGAYLGQITYLLQENFKTCAYNPSYSSEIEYWHKQLCIEDHKEGKSIENGYLNFAENSFDGAISSGVLEHTFEFGMEDTVALINLRKVIKPDGYLFIWNLPTMNSLAEKVARTKKTWKHTLRYELDDLLVKLNLTGFDIIAIERTELFFNKLSRLFPESLYSFVWQLDNKLCEMPFFDNLAHHFTVVAKKVNGFPKNPATSSYTTYTS